jgi:hypothetical protein
VVRCKASEAIDLNQGPDAVTGSELIAAFRVNAVLVKVKLDHRILCWLPFSQGNNRLDAHVIAGDADESPTV